MQMKMDSVLTLEEFISLASEEVSKAIILEEKPAVRDSQVSICVEEINIPSSKKLMKAGSLDVSSLQCDKILLDHEKDNTGIVCEKMLFEESVCLSDCNAEKCVSVEALVKQLQAEVLALKKKRADEGRANEKVASIYASREQAWKAERRRFGNEQRRLWQELQRAFMEQEVLKQRTRRLSGMHEEGDFECEECEQKESWLIEIKERLREQEFVIMASMEEAKAEQHEKNVVAAKLATLETSFCEVNEKLRLETEARAEDLQRHEAALKEMQDACKAIEREKLQAFLDLDSAQKQLTDVGLEKSHYQDLVAELSTEIHMLQAGVHEKEDIISVMLKKADADAEERHELERELASIKAKFLNVGSEKEKWHKYMGSSSPCVGREMLKPRRSLGSKECGFDKMRDLQRLHDVEIHELQSAFEEEVRLLKRRLSLFQERVADLEESILLRMAKNVQNSHNARDRNGLSCGERINALSVFGSHMEPDKTTQEFQLSIARTLLRQYVDTDAQREQEKEKWKKAYFTSKSTIEMLHKERGHTTVSSPRSRGLGDRLELERIRSKLEQRHLQEITAFERQLKARDERMEAFRQQLLAMESEAAQKSAEIEVLKKDVKSVTEEKAQLQELIVGREV